MNSTDDRTRDLRSLLEGIVDEEGRTTAPTAAGADAELALLTSRIRRHRAVRGTVTTMGAVAAAGVIGVVAFQGLVAAPDAPPAVGPAPTATTAPTPQEPDPSPSVTTPAPTPTPTGAATPTEPPVTAAPPAPEPPAPTPTDPEAAARAVFAQYLDAFQRRDLASIDHLTEPDHRPANVPDYTVTGDPSCAYDATFAELRCDVGVLEGDVGPGYFMLRMTVTRAPDGQWWVQSGEFGIS